jgi:hypothetical protein
VAQIEKRFADYGDDRGLIDREFSRRPDMQRKACARPTENSCAYFAPSRFTSHFTDNRPWFVAGRIRQRDVKIAIRFNGGLGRPKIF